LLVGRETNYYKIQITFRGVVTLKTKGIFATILKCHMTVA